MRVIHLKQCLRVTVPVLLLTIASLVIFNAFNGLSEKITVENWHMRDFEGGQQEVRQQDSTFKWDEPNPKRLNRIKLSVVEEHHEVIPYWFKAAMLGLIPKSGNTLIHIDGHSDMAPPQYDAKMPFFHWPKTKVQMGRLMQANDVFIQAAMITGLITRVIYIGPSWDLRENATYAKSEIDIGLLPVDGAVDPVFCSCLTLLPERNRECVFVRPHIVPDDEGADSEEDREFVSIDNVKGFKPSRRCIYEQIVDHVALDMLMTKRNWIGESGNIILDIDEDIFGVELAGQSLVDAGLNWEEVQVFDAVLRRAFCPKRIDHEDFGNRMVRDVIRLFIRRCRQSGTTNINVCAAAVEDTAIITHKLMLAYWERDAGIFCLTNEQALLEVAGELTLVLYQFTIEHLRTLMEFGFCLETSPASVLFKDANGGSLGLCQGSNTPNASIVFLHQPDAAEIRTRTTQLQKILEIIDARHRPSVVTLCRSVRDGYTPRSFFRTIETNILNIFKDLPGHYDVEYDENLYGGKGGWPDRHKRK